MGLGGDQGLLNQYFKNWNRIPFVYNVTPTATYSYAPAFQRFKAEIRLIHYIGLDKPWNWDRVS
jgi:glycogenin glucosyltransferase